MFACSPSAHLSPSKTTCTSRKREITRGGSSCSFAIFGGRPYNETAKAVCEHEKNVDDCRFRAAGSFCFGLCKCRAFRGDAIFGENGHDRACAKHCAAGAHNRFCFGKYRNFRREHRKTRNGGNAVGGFNICRRQNTAADREQHHRACAAESSEPPPAAPTDPPMQETEPPAAEEPAEPKFDIQTWIDYTKAYAESVGLRPESTAVDCWDTPIDADADCIYLERDICSRLNRYAADETITDIWVWCEAVGTNSYLLYIGYA